MAEPLTGEIAPFLDLDGNYVIEFTALDAAAGTLVSGVTVSNASLLVENVKGGDLTSGGEEIAPLWVPIPNDELQPPGGG